VTQRRMSPTHELLTNIAKNPETDPKTRAAATKSLGELAAIQAKIELVRARQKAREKARKDTRKNFGLMD
jgi:hypothetical protein